MTEQPDLERLHQDAKVALAAKDYDRASDLLRQILKADVDYKDAAQLLARVIQLSRRRWYNDPRLWGTLGVLLMVGLGIYLFPKIQGLYSQPAPTAAILPTGTSTPTITPPATATVTETLLPTPTPIPLTWKRISLGLEFPRDTVTAFATNKKDPDVIYASMQNAGVYKTIDGGLSWRPAHHGLSNTQVESLVIDSQNPNILYTGTRDGVYKTEDGGNNWFWIGKGTYLLMKHQDNSHLYAHDDYGIYESTDQGINWTMVYELNNDCPHTVQAWFIHPLDGSTLFVGSWGDCGLGVYQSDDRGRNWRLIELNYLGKYSAYNPNVSALAIGIDDHGNFSYHLNAKTTRSTYDGGAWWVQSYAFCNMLTTDQEHPSNIYCADGPGLFATKGKGYPWRRIGLSTSTISTVYVDHPNGADRILAGAVRFAKHLDEGIFISLDGGTSWEKRNNGLGSVRAELKLDPIVRTRMYLATYYSPKVADVPSCTLYRSLDSGTNWSLIYHNGMWCGPAFESVNNFFLMERGTWQKTQDGGSHWIWTADQRLSFDLPPTTQSLSTNPYIDGLIYAVGDTIHYSTIGGGNWQPSNGSEGLANARLFYDDQGQTVYAIGQTHQAYSTDNGKIWQNCGQDVTASRSDTRLALDLQDSRLYLATPGQGVLISTDSCGSWQASNEGLSNLFVNTLAVDPNNSNTIYAGTEGGAYISFDSGETWNQINDGLLGATVVYSIAVDKESNVYAATPYGVFKLEGK